jgi:hypothetical protein
MCTEYNDELVSHDCMFIYCSDSMRPRASRRAGPARRLVQRSIEKY